MTSRKIDVTEYIRRLGDKSHGLRSSRTVHLPVAEESFDELDDEPSGSGLPDYVYRASFGRTTTFSTCVELVPMDSLLLGDPNRYYHDLGFRWPTRRIGKKQLRRAYQRLRGYSSPRLTYCFKQLLNTTVRDRYDPRLPGQIMGDRYTAARLKKEAARWASQMSADSGTAVRADEFMERELGIKVGADGEVIEPRARPVQSLQASGDWPYDFYLYHSRKHDEQPLSEWQRMLVSAFSEQGLSVQLAVGYCGEISENWIERIHCAGSFPPVYDRIIFLNENAEPTRDLAEAVASHFSSLN